MFRWLEVPNLAEMLSLKIISIFIGWLDGQWTNIDGKTFRLKNSVNSFKTTTFYPKKSLIIIISDLRIKKKHSR